MRKIFFKATVAACIVTGSFFMNNTAFSMSGDTIKPIPRINKEFLVVVHIVLSVDSVPGIEESDILDLMTTVNQLFEPIGASFNVCEFRDIYNFQFNNINRLVSDRDDLLIQYNIAQRINIFFVDNITGIDTDACGDTDFGGIISTGMVGILMRKGNCASARALAHELGHFFSLSHTFEGNGAELVDGSNCAIAGDSICDTPADPYIPTDGNAAYIDGNCLFINTRRDANGDFYDPDVSNIMSYYRDACICRFSRGQYEKMANYYLSNPIVW